MAKETETKKATRVSTVDPNETKADKFKRLAKARMTKALKAIAQLENLSGANYEYTEDEAKKIIYTLNEAVNNVETKLSRSHIKTAINFEF